MRSEVFISGALTVTETSVSVRLYGCALPARIRLESAAATGRKIEISDDGGNTWYEETYLVDTSTRKVLSLEDPATHVKITGANGDTFVICH